LIRVIGVGDNTVDRYLHLGRMFPGGNAVNVAVQARRLGCEAAYLGWLARDPLGMLIYNALLEENVDLSHCRLVEGENAYCDVTLKDGDRVFGEYSEGVCGMIQLDQRDLEFISKFDLTHTSVYSHIDNQLVKLSESSKMLSYDFSQEWDKHLLQKILPHVDIALVSNPPESVMSNEEIINLTKSSGPAMVLITNGDQGAMLSDGKSVYHQPVIRIENMVDTLGAGDAFAARFMVDYLRGIPIPEVLENAAQSAADACKYYGAFGYGAPINHRNKDS